MAVELSSGWYVDGAGVARAVPHAITGLCGKGRPITNGVHLGRPRSSPQGVVVSAEEIPPRNTTDATDEVRVSYAVRAVGSEQGARAAAQRAAQALANAVTVPGRWPLDVTVQDGSMVRVLWAHSLEGPTWTGDVGGEATYRVDVTYRCQPVIPDVRYDGTTRPFAASSLWNTPSPAGTTWFDTPVLHEITPGTATMYWWGRPLNVFYGKATDPVWTLNLPADSGWAAGNRMPKAAETVYVRAPADVAVAAQDGGDGVVVLVDGTRYYEMWLTQVNAGARTITCSQWWDGDIVTGTGFGDGNRPAGVRAINASWLGGAYTGRDKTNGYIDHALAVLLPDGMLNAVGNPPPWRAPATSADNGGHIGPIMCGSKIGIPAGTPKPGGLSPIGGQVFDALITYGAFVVDFVGGGWPHFTADANTTTDADFEIFFNPWFHDGFADCFLIAPLLRVADYQP